MWVPVLFFTKTVLTRVLFLFLFLLFCLFFLFSPVVMNPEYMPFKLVFDARNLYNSGQISENDVTLLKNSLENEGIQFTTEELVVSAIFLCDKNLKEAERFLRANYRCRKGMPELFRYRILEDELLKTAWDIL